MTIFKISKLRYTWRKEWNSLTPYNRDDVVSYAGSAWACLRQHTASDFNGDLTFTLLGDTNASPAWIKISSGTSVRYEWTSTSLYDPGEIVLHGGTVYLCLESHTASTAFVDNADKWAQYVVSSVFRRNWESQARYAVSELISYGGSIYKCIQDHTSGDLLEDNSLAWEMYHVGGNFKNNYQAQALYFADDLVTFKGSLFRCVVSHTASPAINFANWQLEAPGQRFENQWQIDQTYSKGSVVRYGGHLFYALANSIGAIPSNPVSNQWQILINGIRFAGAWDALSEYKVGEVVSRGGVVYIAKQDTTVDGSSLDYLDSSNWEVLISSVEWQGNWFSDRSYAVGHVVSYYGTAYKSNIEHLSTTENFPGDNGSGFLNWDILLLGGPNQGLQQKGDLLTYDLSRESSGDGSSFGPAAVPIGPAGTLLSVNDQDSIVYSTWGSGQAVIFVSPIGLDIPENGTDPFKPWKTIRYACEQVEILSTGLPATIRIETGVYTEVLPIVIPANTALVGGGNGFSHSGDLRSVTVKPNTRFANNILLEAQLLRGLHTRLISIMPALISGAIINKTVGNSAIQVSSVTSSSQMASYAISLLSDINTYFLKSTQGIGEYPVVSGSNDPTTALENADLVTILETNREFIFSELLAFAKFLNITNTINADIPLISQYLINSLIHDAITLGNYKSLRYSEFISNFLLGSTRSNMFYVRNSTGIRNMTLMGLTGDVAPPDQFDLYQRPTGGAFTSLDPGWGPAHETAWISSRSPYIQNVTTIGLNCIGLKVDGLLHNGGLRSTVANDYTQIIDGGIGAWISNNGRVELVSVFTYYARIGYFAENGGVIRATNGNNSYGNFGVVSTGNDNTETPQNVVVNNQSQQATVASVLAGEVNDEILLLEFNNAGQGYTSANYNVVGSGTDVVLLQDDFRDNAISNVRILRPSAQSNGGGGGFTLFGNNAQAGTATSITIAGTDQNVESQLLGLRIIISSGTGTGQYGYVHAYNLSTKTVTVYKESSGTLGWDHVISGTRIIPVLNTTTFYRFEPRPIFTSPAFDAVEQTLTAPLSVANIAYGETSATYSTVTATLGSGTTGGQVVPSVATFTVTRTGRTYSLITVSSGSGYAVNDIISISGNVLGGVSPDNDVFITVLSISGGNTNGINTFEFSGVGTSGKFIVTGTNSNTAQESRDGGVTWEQGSTLPSVGNWKALTSGNNTFVAIRNNSNRGARLTSTGAWAASTLPSVKNWNSVSYGSDTFVAIAGNDNAGAVSSNLGTTWASTTLPSGVNELPQTQFIDWSKSEISYTADAAIAPNGTPTADTFFESSAVAEHRISINRSVTNVTQTFTVKLKAIGRTEFFVGFSNGVALSALARVRLVAAGSVLSVSSDNADYTNTSASITPITGNWYLCTVITTKGSVTANSNPTIITINNAGQTIYAGDTAVGFYAVDPVVDSLSILTNTWTSITYGKNKFLAVSSQGNTGAIGIYSQLTLKIVWTPVIIDTGTALSWSSTAYGNGRFVVISTSGEVRYSLDGSLWLDGDTLPSQDGSTVMSWNSIKYGQGVFFAVCDTNSAVIGGDPTTGATTFATTSQDGISWEARELASAATWSAIAFGNPDIVDDNSTLGNTTGVWVAASIDTAATCNQIFTGSTATGRCVVAGGRIIQIKLWNTGSGYLTEPELTVIDPTQTSALLTDIRKGDGVLCQPAFITTGNNYRSSTTTVVVSGNGFADVIPTGKIVTLDQISVIPSPGAQFMFGDIAQVFTVQTIETFSQNTNGTFIANFRITPAIPATLTIEHAITVAIRERYSQIRITGHDFLDIGTGSFIQTNYPALYSDFYNAAPENEVVEDFGGRAFFTSTDQDGNFRVGDLFAVEQATGIVSISADFFDLSGLTELNLGGVRIGSGAVIREFSTDALFTADSNNIVSTQRSIRAYLNNRLSVGGAAISVPSITAGLIKIGPDIIGTTTPNTSISFPGLVEFSGKAGISGSMLASAFYYKSF